MSHYNYERLTALDHSFLLMESADTPMHVASVGIFDGAPLRRGGPGVDFERISAYVESRLHHIPRYRQKLAYIPIEGHPVWIDDDRFNLHYHLRHTSLPHPGNLRQLKRLCARIMSQQLDRGKPLWETWIVEGLEGGRVAMISKVHHCMVDGISGVDLLTVILSITPEVEIEAALPWIPRPAPSPATLLRDEVLARIQAPLTVAARAWRDPAAWGDELWSNLRALGDTLTTGMGLASETPLNQPIGPHRRFDWTSIDIAAVSEIRQRLGGTLNDIVLATATGAMRRFLQRRNVRLDDMRFRAFVPVSVRRPDQRGTLGNHVAAWMVDLPVDEDDPQERLRRIGRGTDEMRHSGVARGTEILTEVAEWTGSTVLGMAMRLGVAATPFNLVITNVPGPPLPLYFLGARMEEAYPMVPLAMNQGLGIALFSNAGRLYWGFNADWDVLPDLHELVQATEDSFAELRRTPAPPDRNAAPGPPAVPPAAAPTPTPARKSKARRSSARKASTNRGR